MNKRVGFTLAEVLITLVIIGVIAAMTVPTLMNNTQSQEYRTGIKKAIAMLNQAVTMHYALEGKLMSDYTSNDQYRDSVFVKRLNVIRTATSSSFDGAATTASWFYTADGMKFGVVNYASGTCTADGLGFCANILIDVNGDKRPNQATTVATNPKDSYVADLYANRVVPANRTYASDTYVTQDVMYDSGNL